MMRNYFLSKKRSCILHASVIAIGLFVSSLELKANEYEMISESVSETASTYRIIPRPLPKHVGKHLPYSTTNQPTPNASFESQATGPYAYGWFGPKSTPEWSRHFGYGRRYTQWTLK
jgi:hypothetical protein